MGVSNTSLTMLNVLWLQSVHDLVDVIMDVCATQVVSKLVGQHGTMWVGCARLFQHTRNS
jgi:hypothetical protein